MGKTYEILQNNPTRAEELDELLEDEENCGLGRGKDELQQRPTRGLGMIYRMVTVLAALLVAILPLITGYVGYQYGAKSAIPRTSIHEITKDAFSLVVTHIDTALGDEGNKVFTGGPRPEHEEAWDELLRGFNIRVPKVVAERNGFNSYELQDQSGDVWATPYVYHNLHCIKKIREMFYPEHYPVVAERFKRSWDGNINLHLDHCLDGLRQSIMCQGDLSLVGYGWQPTPHHAPHPMERHFGYPHLCTNWEQLHGWTTSRTFDVWNQSITGIDLIGNFMVKMKEDLKNAGVGLEADESPDFAAVKKHLSAAQKAELLADL